MNRAEGLIQLKIAESQTWYTLAAVDFGLFGVYLGVIAFLPTGSTLSVVYLICAIVLVVLAIVLAAKGARTHYEAHVMVSKLPTQETDDGPSAGV